MDEGPKGENPPGPGETGDISSNLEPTVARPVVKPAESGAPVLPRRPGAQGAETVPANVARGETVPHVPSDEDTRAHKPLDTTMLNPRAAKAPPQQKP